MAGGAATGERSESKLFYTPDERWWAVLGNSTGSQGPGVYLYALVDHAWTERLHLPQSDPWMKADALFDATESTLYVALRDNRSLTDNPRASTLYRFTYQGDGAWAPVSGPTLITRKNPEVLTVALDSEDRLWVTFEDAGYVRVVNTAPDSVVFPQPTSRSPLPALPPQVTTDDVSAIRAFSGPSGPRIGVMWSDQVDKTFGFASRDDAAAIGPEAWDVETAYADGIGGCGTNDNDSSEACGDDHISLASDGGQLYAAVKTSLNDGVAPNPTDPLIVLLHRGADGVWESFEVSPVSENASRPIVVLNPILDRLHVFANYRGVHVWESSLASPGFAAANRARWTAGGTGNPTSTKQPVGATTGTVVETSHRSDKDYHHNEFLPQASG